MIGGARVRTPCADGAGVIIRAMSTPPDDALDAHLARQLARLPDVVRDDPAALDRLRRVAVASDFAIDVLQQQPELLDTLLRTDGDDAVPPPRLDPQAQADWPMQLRRYRRAGSTRLIWRDVLGLDTVSDTLAGSTALAETCLALALDALEAMFVQRHGRVLDGDGHPVRLVVFGLGKLGGGELNFSSDVDLVYA